MWQGLLALKNDQAVVQMHFVSGNPHVAGASLPAFSEGGTPPLRIAQRMRLEQTQLDGVARRMQVGVACKPSTLLRLSLVSSLCAVSLNSPRSFFFSCYQDGTRALHAFGTSLRSRSYGRPSTV